MPHTNLLNTENNIGILNVPVSTCCAIPTPPTLAGGLIEPHPAGPQSPRDLRSSSSHLGGGFQTKFGTFAPNTCPFHISAGYLYVLLAFCRSLLCLKIAFACCLRMMRTSSYIIFLYNLVTVFKPHASYAILLLLNSLISRSCC